MYMVMEKVLAISVAHLSSHNIPIVAGAGMGRIKKKQFAMRDDGKIMQERERWLLHCVRYFCFLQFSLCEGKSSGAKIVL